MVRKGEIEKPKIFLNHYDDDDHEYFGHVNLET